VGVHWTAVRMSAFLSYVLAVYSGGIRVGLFIPIVY
jgi:hypothetical protein